MKFSGLGTDIIEIQRIRNAISRHGRRLLEHLFTDREISYGLRFKDPAITFAGRFAAKEAVAKALGRGISGPVGWHDIEIINDNQGKPEVFLSKSLQMHFPDSQLQLSISHAKQYAMAVAIYSVQ